MKKIVVSKETMKTLFKTVLNLIVAGVLIWGIVSVFNLFMKDAHKLILTETVDVSSFKGRILNSSEVSNMPSSCVDVNVDRSTALAFDSTSLLIYHNAGMVIWKPDNTTKNVGLCYTYVSLGSTDEFYYKAKYSTEKKELSFYTYKASALVSAIICSILCTFLAFYIFIKIFIKIEDIFS